MDSSYKLIIAKAEGVPKGDVKFLLIGRAEDNTESFITSAYDVVNLARRYVEAISKYPDKLPPKGSRLELFSAKEINPDFYLNVKEQELEDFAKEASKLMVSKLTN